MKPTDFDKLFTDIFGGKYHYYCPYKPSQLYRWGKDLTQDPSQAYYSILASVSEATKKCQSTAPFSDFAINEDNSKAELDLALAGYGKSDTKVTYKKSTQDYYTGDIYNFKISVGGEDGEFYSKSLALPRDVSLSKVKLKMEKGLLKITAELEDNSPKDVEASF